MAVRRGARIEGAKGRAKPSRSCGLLEVTAVAEAGEPPLDLSLHISPQAAVAEETLGSQLGRVLLT
jgi:hypothetical protein